MARLGDPTTAGFGAPALSRFIRMYSSEVARFLQRATLTMFELAGGASVPTAHVQSPSVVKRGAA